MNSTIPCEEQFFYDFVDKNFRSAGDFSNRVFKDYRFWQSGKRNDRQRYVICPIHSGIGFYFYIDTGEICEDHLQSTDETLTNTIEIIKCAKFLKDQIYAFRSEYE